MKIPFLKDKTTQQIDNRTDNKARKLEAMLNNQSLIYVAVFFCIWLFTNYIYFLVMGTLGFAIFTNLMHLLPSWLSYCIGLIFGFIVSNGFFPIGFANDLLKNHWQLMQKHRASSSKSKPNKFELDL